MACATHHNNTYTLHCFQIKQNFYKVKYLQGRILLRMGVMESQIRDLLRLGSHYPHLLLTLNIACDTPVAGSSPLLHRGLAIKPPDYNLSNIPRMYYRQKRR